MDAVPAKRALMQWKKSPESAKKPLFTHPSCSSSSTLHDPDHPKAAFTAHISTSYRHKSIHPQPCPAALLSPLPAFAHYKSILATAGAAREGDGGGGSTMAVVSREGDSDGKKSGSATAGPRSTNSSSSQPSSLSSQPSSSLPHALVAVAVVVAVGAVAGPREHYLKWISSLGCRQ